MDAAMRGHPYVKSAIDMACWDILGKAAGLPAVALMGGRHGPDAVPPAPGRRHHAGAPPQHRDGAEAPARRALRLGDAGPHIRDGGVERPNQHEVESVGRGNEPSCR